MRRGVLCWKVDLYKFQLKADICDRYGHKSDILCFQKMPNCIQYRVLWKVGWVDLYKFQLKADIRDRRESITRLYWRTPTLLLRITSKATKNIQLKFFREGMKRQISPLLLLRITSKATKIPIGNSFANHLHSYPANHLLSYPANHCLSYPANHLQQTKKFYPKILLRGKISTPSFLTSSLKQLSTLASAAGVAIHLAEKAIFPFLQLPPSFLFSSSLLVSYPPVPAKFPFYFPEQLLQIFSASSLLNLCESAAREANLCCPGKSNPQQGNQPSIKMLPDIEKNERRNSGGTLRQKISQ